MRPYTDLTKVWDDRLNAVTDTVNPSYTAIDGYSCTEYVVELVSVAKVMKNLDELHIQKDQGGRTRHDFSLAWLEAVCHCSGSGQGPTRNEPVQKMLYKLYTTLVP